MAKNYFTINETELQSEQNQLIAAGDMLTLVFWERTDLDHQQVGSEWQRRRGSNAIHGLHQERSDKDLRPGLIHGQQHGFVMQVNGETSEDVVFQKQSRAGHWLPLQVRLAISQAGNQLLVRAWRPKINLLEELIAGCQPGQLRAFHFQTGSVAIDPVDDRDRHLSTDEIDQLLQRINADEDDQCEQRSDHRLRRFVAATGGGEVLVYTTSGGTQLLGALVRDAGDDPAPELDQLKLLAKQDNPLSSFLRQHADIVEDWSDNADGSVAGALTAGHRFDQRRRQKALEDDV